MLVRTTPHELVDAADVKRMTNTTPSAESADIPGPSVERELRMACSLAKSRLQFIDGSIVSVAASGLTLATLAFTVPNIHALAFWTLMVFAAALLILTIVSFRTWSASREAAVDTQMALDEHLKSKGSVEV